MGIFSRDKKTYVSSVVYNMAGDEMNRPNYLKTTVLSSVMNNRPSISDDLVGSYLEGPGMRFRKFASWADRTEYSDTIGLVTGNILSGNSIDDAVIATQIPASPGYTVSIQSSEIGAADYTYWADQWIAENFPERLATAYVTDFSEDTNTITITWVDTTTSSFNPVGYDPLGSFLYVVYVEETGDEAGPLVPGEVVVLLESESFPDTTGWTLISHSDDGAGEIHDVYERETYMGQAPDRDATYTLTETMYQDTVPNPDPDPPTRSYHIDTQNTYHGTRTPMKVFIYQEGTGNAVLDPMFHQNANAGQFFPFIPFRLDNQFVSETYLPQVYEQAKKGYKKATTGKFDDMVESLSDNESLDDIDYAYCVFGVSLNVLENASRKYIYRFFQEILNDFPETGGPAYTQWQEDWQAAKDSWDTWTIWAEAQKNPADPLFGTPQPPRLPYPPMPASSIRVSSDQNTVMNYDMTIAWNTMEETTGIGLLKPDAKRDELWFTIGTTVVYEQTIWSEEDGTWKPLPGGSKVVDEITLNWQEDDNSWRSLKILGLNHTNLIYKGKSVDITAKEALEDPEESGFIIPLHEGIYRDMGLVDGTQMATACSFMVFNCYQVVKEKWYQTDLFKIIIVIIIIVVAIYTGGAGAGAAGGVLGTNAAVGAALGLTGVAAIVAGAILNAIAAMIITRLITAASVALFGEKWGAIIGAIASVIVLQVGSSMASGQSMSAAFNNMMRAENILKLTAAVGEGYAGYVRASVAEMAQETQEVLSQYEAESRRIREAWMENFGSSRGIIDPLMITSATTAMIESQSSFLQRTLMTGSDVAGLSLDMLTNFASMTLSTELPT